MIVEWGLAFCMMLHGDAPNPDTMDYERSKDREHCIQIAKHKWLSYYVNHPNKYDLFTLCTPTPPASQSEAFWVICDKTMECKLSKTIE